MAFAASVAPAAPAVVCKNSRREKRFFFMNVISLGHWLLRVLLTTDLIAILRWVRAAREK
jgi:hypothetical protein